MGFVFDQQASAKQENWYATEAGQACFELQSRLILGLMKPKAQERVLDVGCGSGRYLEVYARQGLLASGLDPSRRMLELARRRLGERAALTFGRAEDLPFSDNEFDIVSLITVLEFASDPAQALAEAVRVARSRVVLGVLNSASLNALQIRLRSLFKDSLYDKARFFTPWELEAMLGPVADRDSLKRSTVLLLPPSMAPRHKRFESHPLVQASPFGAFIGVSAKVKPGAMVRPLLLTTRFKLKSRALATPSMSRSSGAGPAGKAEP